MRKSDSVSTALPDGPKLDELMLAMDVVDTLRHDQRLVERELAADERDEVLIERLRQIYKQQGIDVSQRALEEGVRALREQRFSYKPPKRSFKRSLALAWIERARIAKVFLGVVAMLAATALIYRITVSMPREAAEETALREIHEILPAALTSNYNEIIKEARVERATSLAKRMLEDGQSALGRGDIGAARRAKDDMVALLDELRLEFTLRVVNRPGEASGVWRRPAINSQARNYYLIVEATDGGGHILPRSVSNEETGLTSKVAKWGVRVSSDVFQSVLADKMDDGVIQQNLVGQKRRGRLEIEYVVPVLGGAITKW